EWNENYPGYHGLGYYNQTNADRLDKVMAYAEKHKIYINLETYNHGAFSTGIDPEWLQNPYCKTQKGGILQYATDFFSDKRAQVLYLQRMRYTIARWGYSTAIAWWGVITEAEWVEPYSRFLGRKSRYPNSLYSPVPYKTKIHKETYLDWMNDIAKYIKRNNAHPQIVTTHFSNPHNGKEIWAKESMEVPQNNAYTYFQGQFPRKGKYAYSKGVADVMYKYGRMYETYGKPYIISEWGGHPTKNTEGHLKAELHTGIWANYMTTSAGNTGYWWWNLLDGEDLYFNFKAIADFNKGEDRRNKNLKSYRAELHFASNPQGQPNRPLRYGLILSNQSELFAYIYHRKINMEKRSFFVKSSSDARFADSGIGQMDLPFNMKNGNYKLEYWDTFTGKIIKSITVKVSDANKRVRVLNHKVDIAIKMKLMK
ncbi:MAG: hypothetical protein HRT89_24980, partial [Lentisphaeria bacterium]|nr:hypothetical protein [Lentisphaeria bacterium]